MSKYQALKDALKAGPVEAPWYEHHDKGHLWIENQRDDVVCDMGRGAKSSPTSKYIAAANPATISALLADLEATVSLIEGVLMIDRGASGRIIIEGWQEETIRSALSQLKGD